MASKMRYILIPLFIGLSALGISATLGPMSKNGMGAILGDLADGRAAVLRGAPEPFRRAYTGVAAADRQLSVLVGFFSALVDGAVGWDTTLFYVWGMAQFGAAWTLLALEGMRVGNRGRAVGLAGVAVAGLLLQNLTFAFVVPLYLALHLATSPTARLRGGDGDAARRALFVYLWDLALLPMAVTLTFVAPACLMSLPRLLAQSAATHYGWLAFWQAFPLWTVLARGLLHNACYYGLGSLSPQDARGRPAPPGLAYAVAVSGVYEYALTLCGVAHAPVLLLSVLPAPARSLLASAFPRFAALFRQATFADVFVPRPWSAPPAVVPAAYGSGDLAPLARNFLQYDIYVGTVPLLLWSMYLHQTTVRDPHFAKMLRKAGLWLLLGGPTAACLALNWDRDQVVKEGEPVVAEPKKLE